MSESEKMELSLDCDVYIESSFLSLYRNWNLEPCLKTGGICIYGLDVPGYILTVKDDENRIRTHINSKVYTGSDEIRKFVSQWTDIDIFSFREFERFIGYEIIHKTKEKIKEITGSEGIWFLGKTIIVEEYTM